MSFYQLFTYKNSETPLTSDNDFITMSIGTVVIKESGSEYTKISTNVFNQVAKQILSEDELQASYPQLTEDNTYTGDQTFTKDVTVNGTGNLGSLIVQGDAEIYNDLTVGNDLVVNNSVTSPTGNFDVINATTGNITTVNAVSLNPTADNTGSIGTSSLKWASSYLNNIYNQSITGTTATYTNIVGTTADISTINATTTTSTTVVGTTIRPSATGSGTLGTSSYRWGTLYANTVDFTTVSATTGNFTTLNVSGTGTISSLSYTSASGTTLQSTTVRGTNINPTTTNSGTIGTSSLIWRTAYINNIYGTINHALYSDLAEKYTTDEDYPAGTVLQINTAGDSQMTKFKGGVLGGVVSTLPAYRMNAGQLEGQYIALKGMIPVLTYSDVKKGQYCIAIDGKVKGVDKTKLTQTDMLNLVGVALEDSADGKVLVKV